MTARWNRVKTLFQAAAERPAAERTPFLAEACGDDASLREEVERLLSVDGGEGPLDGPFPSLVLGATTTVGSRVGAFEITAVLGAGGMGDVFRARDTKLDRDVAIKILPPIFAIDPERRARFDREARLLATLNHPHIAAIYELEEAEGVRGLVLELVEGETLAERLERGPVPVGEAMRLARQIADGLHAAHEKGIVHRDLKPANVKITPEGIVKVLDFGLGTMIADAAQEANVSDSSTMTDRATRAGRPLGTAAYMSPEQARGETVDRRTDIWAFGCVLYEMLSGRAVFARGTIIETLAAVLERAPDWTALPAALPAAVRRLLQRCLMKDARQRPADLAGAAIVLSESQVPHVFPRRVAAALISLAALAGFALFFRFGTHPVSDPASGTDIKRLVVLPFENLTGQASDDWLAGAFSDSLTLALENVHHVILVSRERIIQLYNQQQVKEASAIAPPLVEKMSRLLSVRYYVQGSYGRTGDRITVSARLVDVQSGAIRAQESAADSFANLLQVEDALARKFANALEAGADGRAVRREMPPLDAYQSFAEAQVAYATGRNDDARRALERAVAIDDRYAQAWALLGKTYARLAAPFIFTSGEPSRRSALNRQALADAGRAVALDPLAYDAHVSLALANRQLEDIGPWRTEAQKAIDINPRAAEAYELLADSYSALPAFGCGRDRSDALAEAYYRKAIQIDPRLLSAYGNLSQHFMAAARLADAERVADDGLAVFPGNSTLRRIRSLAVLWGGRVAEAEREVLEATEGGTNVGPIEEWVLGTVRLRQGDAGGAERRFRHIFEMSPTTNMYLAVAASYAALDRLDLASAYVERAAEMDATCALYVSESALFATALRDAAFRTLLVRHGARFSP